jgi:hypothetical protein
MIGQLSLFNDRFICKSINLNLIKTYNGTLYKHIKEELVTLLTLKNVNFCKGNRDY